LLLQVLYFDCQDLILLQIGLQLLSFELQVGLELGDLLLLQIGSFLLLGQALRVFFVEHVGSSLIILEHVNILFLYLFDCLFHNLLRHFKLLLAEFDLCFVWRYHVA
jgi:hypothetical protein